SKTHLILHTRCGNDSPLPFGAGAGTHGGMDIALHSMTGFARTSGEAEGWSWAWEVKSVNGRSLEMRLRLPGGFEALEPQVRSQAQARLARGSVNAALTVTPASNDGALALNRALLKSYA